MTSTESYYGFIYTIFALGASHMGLWAAQQLRPLPVSALHRIGLSSVVSRPRFGCYSPVRTGSATRGVAKGSRWVGPRWHGKWRFAGRTRYVS